MVKFGYTFDPETMYQPEPLVPDGQNSVLLWDMIDLHRDGSVTARNGWELEHEVKNGYNLYHCMGSSFKAYQELGKILWPHYPKGLKPIDHISRQKTDEWSNLRRINGSLNNINQGRKTTKGYYYEDRDWLDKKNAALVRKGLTPLSLSKPLRNKFISRVFYKGQCFELGVHETAEEAHSHYLEAREGFIQDTLRTIWCEFLFA